MKYKCQLMIVCPKCHRVHPNKKYGSVKSHLGVCKETINGAKQCPSCGKWIDIHKAGHYPVVIQQF